MLWKAGHPQEQENQVGKKITRHHPGIFHFLPQCWLSLLGAHHLKINLVDNTQLEALEDPLHCCGETFNALTNVCL